MDGTQTTASHPVQELRSLGGHSGPEREGGPAFSRRETGRRGFRPSLSGGREACGFPFGQVK